MAAVMAPSRMSAVLLAVAGLGLASVAQAAPWDEPAVQALGMAARSGSTELFLGDGEWSHAALAWKLQPLLADPERIAHPHPGIARDLLYAWARPELEAIADPRVPVFVLAPTMRGAVGTITPANASGDDEPGLVAARAGAQLRAAALGFEALIEPELVLAAGGGQALDVGLVPRQAWGAWRSEHLLVGFGMRDRWLGPGRRGSLLLSDNARAAPMGTVAAQGHLPGWLDRVGALRFETSWGWLQRPRSDVVNPGLMLMDLRWLPVPWIELGATRIGLFGGQDRPMPGLFELLVPTDPHVYDDPNKEEADQNEQASLDVRVTLPLARWIGGPVSYVEGWWQYGAEDIIALKLGPVPYPSLAGVANLWGLEGAVGPWVLSYEGSHIFDDYFRWYVSHRIYHQGFTQDGRPLGHHIGGDAWSTWLRLGWYPLPWGADLAYEQVHRVGVLESLESNLFALSTDERSWGLSARVWHLGDGGGSWSLGYGFARVEGWGFTPGADGWQHRVSVSWEPGPLGPELLAER